MTDLNEVAARHEARAKAAREKAAHKRRMQEDRAYREAEKIASRLERYARTILDNDQEGVWPVCIDAASKIRASVTKDGAP